MDIRSNAFKSPLSVRAAFSADKSWAHGERGTFPPVITVNFPLLTAILQSNLSLAQRMILIVLLNHADKDGRAWPSQGTIAREAGMTDRAVGINMQALRKAGWLVRTGSRHRMGIFVVTHPASVSALASRNAEPASPSAPNALRNAVKPGPNDVRFDSEPASPQPEPRSDSCRTGFGQTTHEPTMNQRENHPMKEEGRPPPRDFDSPSLQKERSLFPRKPDWREWNQREADQANAITPAAGLPGEFAEAWRRYQRYRTRRATEVRVAGEAMAWTADVAEATLRSCERHAASHGWMAVIAQIDTAIGGSWRGLNFPTASRSAMPGKPKPYQVETATAGHTREEILHFMPPHLRFCPGTSPKKEPLGDGKSPLGNGKGLGGGGGLGGGQSGGSTSF